MSKELRKTHTGWWSARLSRPKSRRPLPWQSVHPQYPFWRLQNDNLWELNNAEGLATQRGNTDAKKSELLEHNVDGGFPLEVQQVLSHGQEATRQ
jgi:predicted restriction endonuclease